MIWYHKGVFPGPGQVVVTPGGHYRVVVAEEVEAPPKTVLYVRVSSYEQKDDLQRQADRVRAFAAAAGWSEAELVKEIGSGLNGHRKKLASLLADKRVKRIVVEHRDRLARFGVNHLKAALSSAGREIVVIDDEERTDDLVRDFVDVVTSMCARIYGRRSAKVKAKAAIAAAEQAT